MATMIRYGTKMGESLVHDMNYHRHDGDTLYQVYGRVSAKKRESWEKICLDCVHLNGQNLHIVGANSYNYTCMYAYPVTDDKGKIVSMVLRKETADNTYDMEMPIEEYNDRIN